LRDLKLEILVPFSAVSSEKLKGVVRTKSQTTQQDHGIGLPIRQAGRSDEVETVGGGATYEEHVLVEAQISH